MKFTPSTLSILLCAALVSASTPFSHVEALRSSELALAVPRPSDLAFLSVSSWSRFILEQRRPHPDGGGLGLPLTFRIAAGDQMPNRRADIIVHRAAALYDTGVAIMALVDAGFIKEARQFIRIYDLARVRGYGHFSTITAFPNSDNGGAFRPFNNSWQYYFNLIPADGMYELQTERDIYQWEFWATHTGPNAWLLNGIVYYMRVTGDRSCLTLARHLGDSMQALQDSGAQGGIRYGPHGNYNMDAPDDPDYDYYRVNSENMASAIAALDHLATLTKDPQYDEMNHRIEYWFSKGRFFNSKTGEMQTGMRDLVTGLIYVDAFYNRSAGLWELCPEFATDSGGTWSISALGPERIDRLWGAGAAFQMWRSIRSTMGWNKDFTARPERTEPVSALDFKGGYPPSQALGSPEWTGGGVKCLDALLEYYGTGDGKGFLTSKQRTGLENDRDAMNLWLDKHSTGYAYGPGMMEPRYGKTGWGWFSGRGDTIVAGYRLLKEDPLTPTYEKSMRRLPPVASVVEQTSIPEEEVDLSELTKSDVVSVPMIAAPQGFRFPDVALAAVELALVMQHYAEAILPQYVTKPSAATLLGLGAYAKVPASIVQKFNLIM